MKSGKITEKMRATPRDEKRIDRYIKENLSKGYSIEGIKIVLLRHGFKHFSIKKLIREYFIRNVLLKPLFLITLLFLIPSLLFIQPPTIGKGFEFPPESVEGSFDYTDQINLDLTGSDIYDWNLGHKGNLTSVKLSGTISRTGSAKVYLQSETQEYLIFDSSQL